MFARLFVQARRSYINSTVKAGEGNIQTQDILRSKSEIKITDFSPHFWVF
jgi:hypothetical protein